MSETARYIVRVSVRGHAQIVHRADCKSLAAMTGNVGGLFAPYTSHVDELRAAGVRFHRCAAAAQH